MNPRRNTILLLGMTLAILVVASTQNPAASGHRMVKFSSFDELQRFLVDKSLYCGNGVQPGALSWNYGALYNTGARTSGEASSTPSHSETNNQVQGVDELDTVKTDGNYLYTVNGSNVIIVKAYPATEARLASIISINGTVVGVFVNGDKLAIFGQPMQTYPVYMGLRSLAFYPGSPYWGSANTTI